MAAFRFCGTRHLDFLQDKWEALSWLKALTTMNIPLSTMLWVILFTLSLFSQTTIIWEDQKRFRANLLTIKNAEAGQKDKRLFEATANALEDLKEGQISQIRADILSEELIKRLTTLSREGMRNEPSGVILRSVCVTLNALRTKNVHPQSIYKQEMPTLIHATRCMADDVTEMLESDPRCPITMFVNLHRAASLTWMTLEQRNPELFLSTKELRFIERMSSIADDWGWRQASKAMLMASAYASRKLIFVGSPKLSASKLTP